MDILSFILGMSVVVVIAVAVVAVIAYVKVRKHKEAIEQIHIMMSNAYDEQNRERERAVSDIYRTLDSRFDKLESKLSSRKA